MSIVSEYHVNIHEHLSCTFAQSKLLSEGRPKADPSMRSMVKVGPSRCHTFPSTSRGRVTKLERGCKYFMRFDRYSKSIRTTFVTITIAQQKLLPVLRVMFSLTRVKPNPIKKLVTFNLLLPAPFQFMGDYIHGPCQSVPRDPSDDAYEIREDGFREIYTYTISAKLNHLRFN